MFSNLRIEKVVISIFFLLMTLFAMLMMNYFKDMRGSSRLVNDTGTIRGAAQRMVKLEVLGVDSTVVEQYIDDLIKDLNEGSGEYKRAVPKDESYKRALTKLTEAWPSFKRDVQTIKTGNFDKHRVLLSSEEFFLLADKLVSSAEAYADKRESVIVRTEIGIILVMIFGVYLVLKQNLQIFRTKRRNRLLETKAFTDGHTGLPNKDACQDVLEKLKPDSIYVCMMFDLNNLKEVNDTKGHIAGDELIHSFAYLLRSSVPSRFFVGRFGGDEFLAVLEGGWPEDAGEIMAELKSRVALYNETSALSELNYACGYAASTEFSNSSVEQVLGQADLRMYGDKMAAKAARLENIEIPAVT